MGNGSKKTRIFNILLNILLFILSYLVPKNKNNYLIGARSGLGFAENSKYLYLYINSKIKDKNLFWITESSIIKDKLEERGLPVVNKYSIRGFWKILRSEKIIFSSGVRDIGYDSFLIGRFNFIELWHGMPMKSIKFKEITSLNTLKEKFLNYLLKKQYSLYKFILHTNRKTTNIMREAFLTKDIEVLGYPRNDGLFHAAGFEDIDSFKKYKKIYFYMPTFRDKKSFQKPFSKKGLKELNKFLKESNSIFLIKKHFAEKNWKDIEGFSNILDISYINDPYEILSITDILITDYSSVCFDFSLLDRPIIFYLYDHDEYIKKSREITLDYYNKLPGPFCNNEQDLFDLIERVDSWSQKKEYRIRYKKFKKNFNEYLDGNSSKRVSEKIFKRD